MRVYIAALFLLLLPLLAVRAQGQTSGHARYLGVSRGGDTIIYHLEFNPELSIFSAEGYQSKKGAKIGDTVVMLDGKEQDGRTITLPGFKQRCVEVSLRDAKLRAHEEIFENGRMLDVITEEPIPNINWELVDETQEWGRFTAHAAKCTWRGKSYKAFYVPEIRVSHGPWKLRGLPGLLVQVKDESGEVSFSMDSIQLGKVKLPETKLPKRLKTITIQEWGKSWDSFFDNLIATLSARTSDRGNESVSDKTPNLEEAKAQFKLWEENFNDIKTP